MFRRFPWTDFQSTNLDWLLNEMKALKKFVEDKIGNAGRNYELPIASSDTLGGIKIGNTLSVNAEDGTVNYNLPAATTEELGGVKVGSQLEVTEDGTLNSVPNLATQNTVGVVKPGETLMVGEDGTMNVSNLYQPFNGDFSDATVFYVDGDIGSDIAHDGLDDDKPFKTLRHALEVAESLYKAHIYVIGINEEIYGYTVNNNIKISFWLPNTNDNRRVNLTFGASGTSYRCRVNGSLYIGDVSSVIHTDRGVLNCAIDNYGTVDIDASTIFTGIVSGADNVEDTYNEIRLVNYGTANLHRVVCTMYYNRTTDRLSIYTELGSTLYLDRCQFNVSTVFNSWPARETTLYIIDRGGTTVADYASTPFPKIYVTGCTAIKKSDATLTIISLIKPTIPAAMWYTLSDNSNIIVEVPTAGYTLWQ